MTQRLDAVDVAKAAGIVGVVFGHVPGVPAWAESLLYSFHMPLFFFLAGCLVTPERLREPAHQMLPRAARSLLLPYLFFFTVSLLYWLATRHLGERAAKFAGISVGDALLGLISGRAGDLFVNIALWFLPCLFLCVVAYWGLRRLVDERAALGISLASAAVVLAFSPLPRPGWPWQADVLGVALSCYAAGQWVRVQHPLWLQSAVGPHMPTLLVAAACALPWLVLAGVQGRVDLAFGHFGPYPVLYLPCAALGVATLLATARSVRSRAVTRWLSEQSLIIFALHLPLINFASGAMKFLRLQGAPGTLNPLWSVGFTAWALFACIPAAWLLKRHLPLAIGRPARAMGAH